MRRCSISRCALRAARQWPSASGLWLLLGYAAITLAAGYGLWRLWPQTRRVVIYTSFWLVAPILAVLVLAFNVPKFNARYVMLAAPALLLVWAVGLAGLGTRRPAQSSGDAADGLRTQRADETSGNAGQSLGGRSVCCAARRRRPLVKLELVLQSRL